METEEWYQELKNEEKYLFDLINKYHDYFSSKDKKYRRIVRILKVLVLFLAMMSTIIFGLKDIVDVDSQVMIGLILSSLITFITAISAYFNVEEYWMRNITIHIGLNMMRDNFIFDVKARRMDEKQIEIYRRKLDDIQNDNVSYWKKAINKI